MLRIKTNRSRSVIVAVLFALFVSTLLIISFMKLSAPIISMFAVSAAKNNATNLINECVNDYFSNKNISYKDIASITTDEQNRVTSIKVDAHVINDIKTVVLQVVTQMFSNVKTVDFTIPAGSLSGNNLFAGKGGEIPFSVTYALTADAEMKNMFVNRGINQTQHQIVLDIQAQLQIIAFGNTESTEINTQITVAETIIVGAIPDIYAGADDELWPNLIEE